MPVNGVISFSKKSFILLKTKKKKGIHTVFEPMTVRTTESARYQLRHQTAADGGRGKWARHSASLAGLFCGGKNVHHAITTGERIGREHGTDGTGRCME